MSKVYVVQKPAYFDRATRQWVSKYDLSATEEYGPTEYILGPGNIYRDRLQNAIDTIKVKLVDFTSDDYILAVGDPIAIALTTMVASEISHCCLNMLKFDRISQRYESYTLIV